MTAAQEAPSALIVGSGPAGAMLALLLGRRGYRVDVLELRADQRSSAEAQERRSINLGLSHRGIVALAAVGVLDSVMAGAVRARGRMIHARDGRLAFQPYGRSDGEILYSIRRAALLDDLVRHAAALPNVCFHFGVRCESINRDDASIVATDVSGARRRFSADFVVGADGAFSTVRRSMHHGARADFEQQFLEWGYKELTIPTGADGRPQLEVEALHIWPRGSSLIVTHPNVDGSHSATVFMPWEGEDSFESLAGPEEVRRFFRRVFPDLVPLAPGLAETFLAQPTGSLVTTRTMPWHHGDRAVLLGDSCHAVFPFYGQGMNAALEDCLVLDAALARDPADRQRAFREYQEARKRNTDALQLLVRQNFDELRDTANGPTFVARKQVDLLLNRLLGPRWMPLYTMVAHTTMPYADALARHRRQARLLRWVGVDALLRVGVPVVVALRGLLEWARRPFRAAPAPLDTAPTSSPATSASLATPAFSMAAGADDPGTPARPSLSRTGS